MRAFYGQNAKFEIAALIVEQFPAVNL